MRTPYVHIACCIETSPALDGILAEAEHLRQLGKGRLSLVHVVEPPDAYRDVPGVRQEVELAENIVGRRWLEAQCKRIKGAEPVLLEGRPVDAVCAWAAAEGVDLIIAGAHRGPDERRELGSFAGELAYSAPANLHLVRPPRGGSASPRGGSA